MSLDPNIVQWREAGYFDASAATKPLLHLWSLGIEEQFYLGWPLIALAAWRRGKRIFLAAILIVVLSFAICVKATPGHPVAAFYLPTSRAWELLLGGALATRPIANRLVILGHASSLAGAMLILAAIVVFDATTPYPGWRATVPTIGTALLIWAGPDAVVNRRILALPLFVGTGLISYPLYLWHWPILSYLSIVGDDTVIARALAVVLALILAWSTFYFVERPIRRAGLRISIPLAGSLAVIAAAGLLVFGDLLPAKWDNPMIELIDRAKADWIVIGGVPIKYRHNTFYRDGNSASPVLFIGDSNMQQYLPRVHDIIVSRSGEISAIYATQGGCAPIPGMTNPAVPQCASYAREVYEFASASAESTVVIAAQWGYFYNSSYFFDGRPLDSPRVTTAALDELKEEIRKLVGEGKKVYLVLGIPVGQEFSPQSWIKRSIFGIEVEPRRAVARADIPDVYARIASGLSNIAREAGAMTIDPYATLCDKMTCRVSDQSGMPIYKDGYHLRGTYVRQTVRYIDQVLE